MTRQTTKFSSEKAKQVILYLLNKCGKMTKKKLTYLLFYICFDYWEKEEKSICGLNFFKTKQGIKIKELDNILKEMEKQKMIKTT